MKAPEIRLMGVLRNLAENQNVEATLNRVVDGWENVAIDASQISDAIELLKQYIITQITTLDDPVWVGVVSLVMTIMVRLDPQKAKDAATELLAVWPQPGLYRQTIEQAKEAIKI